MSKEYHAAKATPEDRSKPVSKSTLWRFNASPWKWGNTKEKVPTAAMQLGSVVHILALEPEKASELIAVSEFDSFRTKEARSWRDEQISEGLIVMSAAEYAVAEKIAGNALACIKEAVGCPYKVEKELHGEFNDVAVCGLVDIVPDHYDTLLWDLKTCSSIGNEHHLQKTIFDNGYHTQGALYLDLNNHKQAEKGNHVGFGFIFVETSYPYEATYVTLSLESLVAGRQSYIQLVERWKELLDVPLNELPGAVAKGAEIEPPAWFQPV